MKRLEDLVRLTQSELFLTLCKMFKGEAISRKGSYILVRGEAPVMLLAHLDTVHKEQVRQICKSKDGNILMSPQGIGGDDRCGVYALLTVYEKSEKKPWLLFTCDEEIGGVGAQEFCKQSRNGNLPNELSELKMLIEIDRKGDKDAVYYDCGNADFEEYITGKGFKTEFGSFSDISLVAPELGVAAVNLSSGYYNAHTLHEYIDCRQLNATIEKVIEIIAETVAPNFVRYEYVDSDYGYWNWGRWDYAYGVKGKTLSPEEEKEIEEDGLAAERWDAEFEALMDIYDPDMLDDYCRVHGVWAIHELFLEEFGDLDVSELMDEPGGVEKKRGGEQYA